MPTSIPVKFISNNAKFRSNTQPQINLLKEIRKAVEDQHKSEIVNEKKYLESLNINKKLSQDYSKVVQNYKNYQERLLAHKRQIQGQMQQQEENQKQIQVQQQQQHQQQHQGQCQDYYVNNQAEGDLRQRQQRLSGKKHRNVTFKKQITPKNSRRQNNNRRNVLKRQANIDTMDYNDAYDDDDDDDYTSDEDMDDFSDNEYSSSKVTPKKKRKRNINKKNIRLSDKFRYS